MLYRAADTPSPDPFLHPFSTLSPPFLHPFSTLSPPFLHPSSTLPPPFLHPIRPFLHPSSILFDPAFTLPPSYSTLLSPGDPIQQTTPPSTLPPLHPANPSRFSAFGDNIRLRQQAIATNDGRRWEKMGVDGRRKAAVSDGETEEASSASLVMSYHVLSYFVMFRHVCKCSKPVLSCPVLSCPVLSCPRPVLS